MFPHLRTMTTKSRLIIVAAILAGLFSYAEQLAIATEVPNLVRRALGKGKPAADINTLDEVSDSSWFTRAHSRTTSGMAPDLSHALVTGIQAGNGSPRIMVRDAAGVNYMLKFDGVGSGGFQSATDMVIARILSASGYNVPETDRKST